MAGPYAVIPFYLDKTVENNQFKHPPLNGDEVMVVRYDKDCQKLVEGEPNIVVPPTGVFDACWDWDNSNEIVNTAWKKDVTSRVVKGLRIVIEQKRTKSDLYVEDTGESAVCIKTVVITGVVNRYTGKTRWEEREEDRRSFSLTNLKDDTKVTGKEGIIKLNSDDLNDSTITVEIDVVVQGGDRAIRVILEPIIYDPNSNTTSPLPIYKDRRHGRIFLSTFGACCKYNTLEMERVHIYLHMQSRWTTASTIDVCAIRGLTWISGIETKVGIFKASEEIYITTKMHAT